MRTHRAIAEAASRLFAERGYEETTIADIAEAADVSPRTFFSYFPSKDDVVFAEMDERISQVRRRVADRPAGETPLQTMRTSSLEMMRAIAAEGGEHTAVQMRLILDHPGLRAKALTRLQDAEDEIAERLTEIPELDEIDSVVIAGAIFGALRATIQYCRIKGHDAERTWNAANRAIAIVEQGLASVPALNAVSQRS